MFKTLASILLVLAMSATLCACYGMRSSIGGGQVGSISVRATNPQDIALPEGYSIEAVSKGLTFPTGVAFDDSGGVFVTESGYSYGEVWAKPRLLQVNPESGQTREVASGSRNGPWTGVTFHKGAFYVAEGGELEGGRILRITKDGVVTPIIEGLPSRGDHHTNGPAAGPDGMIYFSIGTCTNSGVVGEDNYKFGWLKRNPEFHDIPCQDISLAGENFTSNNLLKPESQQVVETGAFSPFGIKTAKGQVIKGEIPCSGAVLRMRPEGGKPELVAWGFRNPFGLAFSSNGRLYATENQYDERGSRPIFGAGDLMWEIKSGWYGWPDYHGRNPVDMGDRYEQLGKTAPKRLLISHPALSPVQPCAIFGVHASANGFDFSKNPGFGHQGEAFVAEFGDQAPDTGKVLAPVGFKVVRVNVENGEIRDFAANRGNTNGPASWLGSGNGGLERPLAARFDPTGTALYVVDFGILKESKAGPAPLKETGVLWRITRKR